MILPWKLLWVVQLSRKEKFGIGSVVGLGIVIVAFAIVRIVVTNTAGTHPEPLWLAVWSSVETSVAVIVVSSTALKVFLVKSGNTSSGGLHGSGPYSRGISSRNVKEPSSRGIPLTDQTPNSRYEIYKSYEVSVERKHSSGHSSKEILVH